MVLTAPFLINSAKTNRKGFAIFPTKIQMFNDKGELTDTICQFTLENGKALMSNGRAFVELVKSGVCISNTYNSNCWFNYFAPSVGYAPTLYIFGDGTQGGHADIRANTINGNYLQIISGTGGSIVAYITSDGDFYTKSRVKICKTLTLGENSAGITYSDDYPLLVYGQALADKWVVHSERAAKENITSQETLNAVEKILQLKFYSYNFKKSNKTPTASEKTTAEETVHINLGIMADEAPEEIRSSDDKGVDLYAYTSLVAKSVQEMNLKIEEQAKKIEELERKLNAKN